MLARIIAVPALAVVAGCGHSDKSTLVGSWHWKSCDDAGEVVYLPDHTFTTKEWAVTNTHQPPVLQDAGKWHVRRGRLIIDFSGDTRLEAARHAELPFIFFDTDTLIVRTSDGRVNTFERVK